MKPEQINIAIAEHLGWKPQKWDGGTRWVWGEGTDQVEYAYAFGDDRELPNYSGDLNAMHEAEKALTAEQCGHYNNELCEVKRPYGKLPQSERWTWGTTPEHRAEAFLRTVGKWIEATPPPAMVDPLPAATSGR